MPSVSRVLYDGECIRISSCFQSYICARRNRNALLTTDTELKLIAAAAIIGLRSRPKTG